VLNRGCQNLLLPFQGTFDRERERERESHVGEERRGSLRRFSCAIEMVEDACF
jgi:hypothetical protein